MVADSLKQHAEIKTVPCQAEVGSIGETRQCSITNLYAVVRVKFTVTIGITIQEVTEFRSLVRSEVIRVSVDKALNIVEV